MENLIEVKYQFKEHQNAILCKFFKTEEQANSFKEQHPDYVFIGDK